MHSENTNGFVQNHDHVEQFIVHALEDHMRLLADYQGAPLPRWYHW